MTKGHIHLPDDAIAAFCARHHIQRMALFGSVLRDDFGPTSDLDILVEFEPDYRVGLITFVHIKNELTDLLANPVDLITPGSLSPYFREKVLQDAEIVYDAA